MLRIRGVRVVLDGHEALAGVDLDVERGTVLAVLGPSGSGKSTLLRAIAGLQRLHAGSVELDGRPLAGVPPHRRGVGLMFQDDALFPHHDVGANIAFGLRMQGVPAGEASARVASLLALVGLEGRERRAIDSLSGGEQKRVALARALAPSPRVLLLDEPLGALDLKLREHMQVELKQIQQRVGITFIYVTHDQDEALTMSDRLAVFNLGGIEQVGTPEAVYEHPANEFVAAFVGTSNLLERDGVSFTVRPEKIRLLGEGAGDDGLEVERGRVIDVAYAGMMTRYMIELEAGGELQVVRQNLEETSREAHEQRGRQVFVGWRREHTVPVAQREENT